MFDHSLKDKSYFIQEKYPLKEEEYLSLEKKYDNLCWFAATKLVKQNRKHEDDLQDYHSEIKIGMFRAGSYYKRQLYIDSCFNHLNTIHNKLTEEDQAKLKDLLDCWENGAEFTFNNEDDLLTLFDQYKEINITKDQFELSFDDKFNIYCKAIIWNTSKALGQKISKENEVKSKEMSLDEWQFLERADDHEQAATTISFVPSLLKSDNIFSFKKKNVSHEDLVVFCPESTDDPVIDEVLTVNTTKKAKKVSRNLVKKS